MFSYVFSAPWAPNAAAQPLPKAPGSQGMLPYPSPLRTVHESRPSHGSSPCCFVSMSLVVAMVTPRMHKHAVFLAIFPTLLLGFAVVIVDRIAGIKERFAQTTTKGLRLESALSLLSDGESLQAPLYPLFPVCLQVGVHR